MAKVSFILLTLAFVAACEAKFAAPNVYEIMKAQLEETERGEVCMGELGCFNNNYNPWGAPFFERLVNMLPEDSTEIRTEFRFYAPGKDVEIIKNQDFAEHITENSGFDASLNTKFIIHGYMGGDAPWALEMKDAFMQKEQCNVFIVDWSNGDGSLYEQAVSNTRVVGAETGLFIKKLVEATQLDLSKIHILGHSLGGHTAGYAGKWVKNALGSKVGRITGLDPAGPYFNDVYPEVRLDIGDAEFVDAIHTNWAEHRFSGFGLWEPVAHFDFYPNGGEDQPGCKTASEAFSSIFYTPEESEDEDDENKMGIVDSVACSHGRAYQFFTASILEENCGFYSKECSSYEDYVGGACDGETQKKVQMGYNADQYKDLIDPEEHIKFYLLTSAKSPYCLDVKE